MLTPLNEYHVFGDVEAMVVDILTNSGKLDTYNIDSITTDMRGFQAGMTWVEIALEGGSYKFHRTKRCRIDITVYAPLRKNAYLVAATAQAVMFSMQASYKGFGLNYQACQIETDIFKSDEKDTQQVRYIQSLRLLVVPDPR